MNSIFSFNKYKKYLFHFWLLPWFLPEEFSFARKIMVLPKFGRLQPPNPYWLVHPWLHHQATASQHTIHPRKADSSINTKSFNCSFIENQFGSFGRVVHRVGRLNDESRNGFLVNHGGRAIVMDALQMQAKINPLPIGLSTRRALVRPLSRVGLLVWLEMAELGVWIVADRTNVWFFTCVGSHVHRQCILVDECLQNHSTITNTSLQQCALITSAYSGYMSGNLSFNTMTSCTSGITTDPAMWGRERG